MIGMQDSNMLDALVVGGGINGAGIARDLAGRGQSVMLVERDDWASHTSSASSKMIHGGLRYLEQYAFGLVRKSLQERERLLKANPHLMQPLRLVLPHDPAQRPRWMIRLGLFFYDHLAPLGLLPASGSEQLAGQPYGEPLQARFTHGFAYSDGWVDDARLVWHCVLDARQRGARAQSRCALVKAERIDGATPHWRATLQPEGAAPFEVQARALVNAAGPWAAELLGQACGEARPPALRWVQGTHIVIPRRWNHGAGYLLQNPDGRVLFALPYQDDFTLLGTTDQEITQLGRRAQAQDGEVDYLCEQASRWLREPVTRADIRWQFAGIRPLLADEADDPKAITRDYRLDLLAAPGQAARLDVWGGKITTFRLLAEQAADLISPLLGGGKAWTLNASLPGGDCGPLPAFIEQLRREFPHRDPQLIRRWALAHGSRARALLQKEPGTEVVPGISSAELQDAVEHEDVKSADDFLWRRSKLGLRLSTEQRDAVERAVQALMR